LDRKRLTIATSLLAGGLLVFCFSFLYPPQFIWRYHSLLAGLVGIVGTLVGLIAIITGALLVLNDLFEKSSDKMRSEVLNPCLSFNQP
jgi:hypothetical protein